MGYLFNTFDFEPGSRMTGIWTARERFYEVDVIAFAHQIQLGRDQDGSVEADFLGAHLPFHAGGFHGVGPDGHPWAVVMQVAPGSCSEVVGAVNPYWPMFDGMKRALRFNPEASVMLERGWTSDELLGVYAGQGVDPARVDDWTVPEFLMGLLAECCYVPLPDIVGGRIIQCAFPDVNHDCEHDVFTDVFARWDAGHLNPEEPPL